MYYMTVGDMKATLEMYDDVEIIETHEDTIKFESNREEGLRLEIAGELSRDNVTETTIDCDGGVWVVKHGVTTEQ